ncbi:MAG: hypothetical protein KME23_08070 [Goleter apudmare HA4340-LM2]|jgi:hypothetical protein|nr:hypothetical protein [Goleter apudmare HA4340-LM2]
MKIQTITYKRVKNLGNYQSETLEATAIVFEDGDPDIAANILREFVLKKLYPEAKPEEIGNPDGF